MRRVTERTAVPGVLRRRLWIGICGAAAFMTSACADGARRPDFDPWHQSISALSLGPDGWLQIANFMMFGAAVLTTVPAWRRILWGGIGGGAVPVLTAMTGVSLILAGLLPQDPAPGYDPMALRLTEPTLPGLLHLLVAAVAAGSSIAVLAVMSKRFGGDPKWPGWSAYSLLMSVAMTVCVAVYAVWSTAASGYAGAFERAALMVTPIWGATFLRQLATGRPFMVARDRES